MTAEKGRLALKSPQSIDKVALGSPPLEISLTLSRIDDEVASSKPSAGALGEEEINV